ncbi:MogA/MoaB family molybdenum cofactor biosynthesis protein [Microbacterium sp. EYE_5]|uniref:MogA/MoaB family molybdenum cofactor biosynthesis protein n=1 Tax=unclassified Microbacterium TaxID=2609290 RepID=UPI00200547BE|nr:MULTISPECIES: molybdenum cofactor synthesis domain-containing protein [unclassified Microbacterium]MCK6081738.1 MogA/MoaB family molybdenum cofactor biosynthesis protein [Microbacterium sp. EYE_382]MCK6087008.1 MogA/MoaB family molybdenum cofactor biosynthesis protein [Microbacterium sp. EYE_384]MCK6125014.1 MogA/MoaB family molybdenum cofactor biosynthesis protein [Microbacterium sp. EYE_80]MCK6127771.1 MogA/MoaB family molybdenum cofactor biosynthesis protein [Microbacterium sp. EYE_79]MC
MTSLRAYVITVSDRSASGAREDRAGPRAVELLAEAGIGSAGSEIVPDGADAVEDALRRALATGARLVVTTGGTGVGPRDRTPEGTERVVTRAIPGIAEELRRVGIADTPLSVLSRGVAGIADPEGALIVNLPGSPRAVASGIPVIVSVAAHVVDQVKGGDHS